MMNGLKSISRFVVLSILCLLISQIGPVSAQNFEKSETEDVISQLSNLMDNTFDLEPDAESVWEDYIELLTNLEYQDYTKDTATGDGSTYEEISAFFSPDAEETVIEYDAYEKEYIYTYDSSNLDQLSIHFYLYNDGLYATSFISNQIDIPNENTMPLEDVNEAIRPGWPRMDVLQNGNPTIVGLVNMFKDEQLGSIVALPSQDSTEEKMLEFITYEGDVFITSVYFTPENYEGVNDGTLRPMSDQLLFYAVADFIPSDSLEELVTQNTTDNLGYRLAQEQLTVLLDNAVMRGLEDNVAGTTMEEVKENFQPEVEMTELELEDPITALAYRFEDPNNINSVGILTVYFFENQLAFASAESVEIQWNNAEVGIDYSNGIEEDMLNVGDTLTGLAQTSMEVPAVGIMFRDAFPHQVAVIPVRDSENEVFFVDIYNYRIENYTINEITGNTGELSDDLFDYIFNQY
ncbi:hypothetical protein HYQ40_01340 [Aerococcaceae bacterium DSM 111021]|nr:hypothetical protein [Aerococcaceae bacterium DSM 111021]